MDQDLIDGVRRFNRTVTQSVGALDDAFLARARPLGQARLLWEIGPDGSDIRALRARLDLDSGYLSRLLRSLEQDGLAVVGVSDGDGRVRTVRLTTAGMAERAELDRRSDAAAATLLDPLTEAQRQRLVGAMAEVERLLVSSAVRIATCDPSHPDARYCLRSYADELARRFDGGFDPALSISASDPELRPPAGLFLVATLHGEPAGCGALKFHRDAPAEIKRMWVAPKARGLGLGRRLLAELEALAAARGVRTLRLETNRALGEAISLYASAGFREVAPFNDEPYAHHWFEKTAPAGTRYGAGMAKRPQVTVLGSLNMDISVTVPRLPGPGMTVLGSAAVFTPGGKGANQAVAAARLGAEVRMTGCVGDDDFGRQLLDGLRAGGVDGSGVRVAPGAATGLAMISVDGSGENIITVAPGANHEVGDSDVDRAVASQHDVLVISAEIPVPVIRSALAAARGTRSVLNLAPAPPQAAAIVADGVDWLVVNESEAAAILGRPVDGLAGAAQAAAALVAAGARCAVVTAGAHGAALAGRDSALDDVTSIPAFRVEAVDTVGAGDTFVGALAVALAAGVPAPEAVRAAAAAGATAATRHGAQAGMPRPADIAAITGLTWPVA